MLVSNILIVDDNPKNIQLAASVLKECEDYKIIYAMSGATALERLEGSGIDLILLDIMMPDMDGFETASRIKSDGRYEDIPIIFLTANNDEATISKAYECGGQDFISKPFKASELISRIKTHLELRRARIELKSAYNEQRQLLEQYKTVIDLSTIVSKSDTKGNITYANDAFCKVSGYDRGELLGKAHNLLRHSDMPKKAFSEMWKTIQSKQTWQGIVKNRKKDGGTYIVQATVMPIVDTKGEISEYISCRNDITEIFELREEIEETQREVVFTLGDLCESRSEETGFHVKRVAEYSRLLGLKHGLSEENANLLAMASPMHDVGKVAIPDAILLKPGKLTEAEFEEMKKHTLYGYDIFKNSKRQILKTSATIAYEHHERWDGSGYPRGLAGEDIHLFGRITAVADVYDALSCDRVYKKAWRDEDIEIYFKEQRGKQFDPELVDLLFENLKEIHEIRAKFSR